MHADVTSLLLEAAYLMAVGMSVVFLFLGLLIAAMALVAWLNRRFSETVSKQQKMSHQTSASKQQLPAGVIAAITAAVHQHRNK